MSARRAGPRPQRRVAVLCLVFVLLFAAVSVRLVQLQAVGEDRYVAFGESQRVRSLILPADRGSIFDRNGDDLALSVPQRTVWADPTLVADPVASARALAPLLNADPLALETKLSRDGAFVYLARRVPDEVAAAVDDLELDGVYLLDEPTRFTPSDDLGRAVLGTVGADNQGLSGLELQFDEQLTGEPGELILERAPGGRTIAAGQRRIEPAQRGHDLLLTLDRSFQFEAERVLGEQIAATGAKGGTAIVARPGTGEILALANMVADPETGLVAPTGNNIAVTSVFEPGSVNKMITLAAALEEGLVTPETQIEVPDHLRVSDHTFSDHDPHPTQNYTVTRILAESLNIGTIKIGQMLGPDLIDRYLQDFGFGTRTALEFPNESAGLMLDPDDWSGTSLGSIPIGQGIAVTATQMLFAFNTIANDGVYVPPRLVLAEVDDTGARRAFPSGDTREVVSQETATRMRAMLAEVVADGTGRRAAVDGYTVAGKTGTARKPQPGGGYIDGAGNYHYVATFVGMVPAEHPELSIIVVVDEPSSSIFGGSVSAPVFADLARYGMRLLQIPPTGLVEDPDAAPLDPEIPPPDEGPVRAEPATVPDPAAPETGPGGGPPATTATTVPRNDDDLGPD